MINARLLSGAGTRLQRREMENLTGGELQRPRSLCGSMMGGSPPRDMAEAVRVGLERVPLCLDHRSALLMVGWVGR